MRDVPVRKVVGRNIIIEGNGSGYETSTIISVGSDGTVTGMGSSLVTRVAPARVSEIRRLLAEPEWINLGWLDTTRSGHQGGLGQSVNSQDGQLQGIQVKVDCLDCGEESNGPLFFHVLLVPEAY